MGAEQQGSGQQGGATPPEAPQGDQGEQQQGEGQQQQGQGDEQLGPAGLKALEAEKAKRRDEAARRRAAEAEAAALREQLASAQKPPSDAPDLDKVRSEAEKAALAKANSRIVAAELRAAATGKLTDPSDATVFLADRIGEVHVGADGAVDAAQIADLIDDLISRKPHLAAAQPGPRFTGSADGGARRQQEGPSIDEQIQAAQKAGNLSAAIALKLQKAAADTQQT